MAKLEVGIETPEEQAPEIIEPVEGEEIKATEPQVDEVTTLKSRNAGLDAKVTSLSKSQRAETVRANSAEAKLQEYIGGKAVEDEDTKALIQRLTSENEQAKTAAKIAGLAAKYPETSATVGTAIAYMTEDELAASEARFTGVPAESNHPPVPVGNNAARPATGVKTIEEMSLAELKVYAQAQFGNLTGADLVNVE